MAYNWEFSDIEKSIEELKLLADNESDIYRKCLYMMMLDMSSEEIAAIMYANAPVNYSRQEKVFDLVTEFELKRRYYRLVELFYENAYRKKYEQLFDVSNDETSRLQQLKYSDDECVKLARDFYMGLDDKFSSLFSILDKDIHTSVKFNDRTGLLDEGMSIYIGGVNKNFIYVDSEKGMEKVVTLVHECGHALASLYNPILSYKYKDRFSLEIPSLFFELAFLYEYGYNIDSLESSLFQCQRINYLIYNTLDLIENETILNEWKTNGFSVNTEFYRALKEKYDFTRVDVGRILNVGINYEGSYIVGYLVALHLLNIYKQDKKDALRLLRVLLNMQDKDTYSTILPIIGDFSKTFNEYDLIMDRVKDDFRKKLII